MKLIPFKDLGPLKGINYSPDHLRRKWKAGEFPRPVAISDRRIAWWEDEVDGWLAARPRREDAADKALDRRIDEIGLTRRAQNALGAEDIVHVRQLIERSEQDLLLVPNLGRVCLRNVNEVLAKLGLRLGTAVRLPHQQ